MYFSRFLPTFCEHLFHWLTNFLGLGPKRCSLKEVYLSQSCKHRACNVSGKWTLSQIFFQEFCLLSWNKYLKGHFWLAGSASRDLMKSQRTDERWKTKESYWSQNYQGIERVSIGQKYQQRNVFTSNGDSNEKLSLKLAVPKFAKRSFQIIFSKTYLFTKIL